LALSVVASIALVDALVALPTSAAGSEVLYAWGDNTDGALGNGTTTNAFTPIVITLPGGVAPTGGAAGTDHSLVIGSNGFLYAWGLGTSGQLGNGTTTSSSSPVKVSLPSGVVPLAVAAGEDHSLAIGSNNTLYAWGYNGFGQLGNGTTTNASSPVAVSMPSGVHAVAVAAGSFFSLALGSDGNVYAWGDGNNGSLGQGNQNESNTPVKVPLPSGVTASAISAGSSFAMAIGSNGTLYAWGDGGQGQLGDNTTANSSSPVAVQMPSGVTASVIALGTDHALAIGSNDLLYSWGDDADGQLGTGGTNKNQKIPDLVQMPSGVAAVAIAGGMDHSLAIGSNGNLYAWGLNSAGELGNGGTTESNVPVLVSLPTAAHPPTAVLTGSSSDHSFAIAPPTPTATSTTLGASATSEFYGQSDTLTATVSPTDGGGTVQFLNGSTPVPGCTAVPLSLVGSSYQAPCLVPSLVPGSYNFTAAYSGDTGYASSTSSAVGVNVAKAPLVITASSSSSVYGSSPAAVTASYNGFVNSDSASSLTTQPTCSTTATSSSAAGTYPTSCSGAVDSNYAITYVNGTQTVTPAPLSLTASSGTMNYGGTPPTITASYSGFVNNDNASSLATQPTCSTTATSSSPVGTYASSCTGAVDPNYTISYSNGKVVIGAVPLVITASSSSTTYGASPPTVTASYSGFVNGDTAASLTTQPTCSTTATSSSPVGAYHTTCSGAVDSNYTITYMHGNQTVIPAPITITASSGTSQYGSNPPAVTPIVTGLQNGEDTSVLGSGLSCSTSATSGSPVGSYATYCLGASDPNYAISYSGGSILVTPAPLSITASSGSLTYGGYVPPITPTITGLQNGDSSSVLGAGLTCGTTATSTSTPGTYTSSCSGASDPNYTITYVNGTVTLTPAPLTITASSDSMTYGGTVPTITAIVSGLQNGEDSSVLGTGLTCDTASSSSSPVGSYASACMGANDGDYAITYVFGVVNVTPAALQVTASSDSMTYGGTPPTITASYSGFVNGDNSSSLTTQPNCSTTASSSSAVGTYTSSCSGASDPNYTITYANGSVQVVTALVVVTASSDSMTYGGTPPTITASYSGFENNDNAASLTTPPTCSTAATSSSPAGTYTSSCSGAVDPNYSFTYVNGSVTVDPAPLSIAASSDSMTYGGTTPTITASYSGFVNGDSASSLTTQPTCSTTATSSSPAGAYTSSCSGAVDPNYTISFTQGAVVIGTAVLVVSASSDSMTYGGTTPTITASYSGFVNNDNASSLTTQPTCSTTATSSSSAGSYVTSCSGAVDSNYTISYVAGAVTVAPAPLTVTASSDSMTYGGTPPTITASYSGFVNNDNASSLTTQPTCSTAATSSSPVGTYATSCSGAVDSNYAISYVSGSVVVNPAALTITASSPSSTYGIAVPAVTASYSGFVNNDNASSLTTAPTCSTAATSSSPAGTYATSCSGAVDANYMISYVNGAATINPALLVITASSASMTYGEAAPAITASYLGFVNGDTVSSLTTAPTCSTSVTSVTGVGTYPSSCTGAVDPNYTISYIGGTVQVVPMSLTITASSTSLTYGGTAPTVTASYSGFVNNDNASSLTTQPTCSTAATSSSPAGNYPSSCSGAADPNYTISYINGSVQVTPAALSVTASSATMTYGGTPPTITASYSGFVNNDNASSLTSPPVCSSAATSASPVGTYPSSCSGADDPNYTISYAAGQVGVEPAALMVTASSGTMTYGGTPPTISAGYAGFVNHDNASSLSTAPVCSTTATSSSPVGSYPSSCSGAADPNYTISYVNGNVQVTTAGLVVTASSGSVAYGSTPPTITPSYTGFENGDNASSLSTQPTCSTSATSSSPIGNYPSSCSGAADSNYSISYVNGNVKVTTAALVVTASSASMTYGSTPPAITPSYSGFANGDNASSLTTQATCSTTATSSSPAGSYPSSCSGATDPNYGISYVPGAVAVGTATLVITASSGSMTYGGTVPATTASYAGFVNGDTSSSLTTQPTCTTTATSSSPAGNYTTSCSGAVDPNYNIVYVPGTVHVNAATLTVTASSSSVTYGHAVPAITASYAGFVNGDTSSSLTTQPTCTTTATSSSPAGNYATSCSGAVDPNYNIVYVPGAVHITQANLTITALSASVTYGHAVPAITAGYAGFVNGDTTSSLTTKATCSTAATSSSPAGSYATNCSGAVDPNYNIVYVPGTVQINPANLTITASSATVTYGSAAPAITASYSGFVNGDTVSSLATKPTCTTTVTSGSTVGTYQSTCSGATDPNYAIAYVAGTVTVSSAVLTVTANNQTKAFGAAIPTLTATITGFVNGQTLATSGVSGSASCTTTATASSPGGTYPITCSQGTLSAINYTFTFVPGTLTITFSQIQVCDHIGPVVVTSGESVLIPAGCVQIGPVTVQPGGSLQSQGAIIVGNVSVNNGVTLLICSTALGGILSSTGAQNLVVIGNGTSSCLGDILVGDVDLNANNAGVMVNQAAGIGSFSLNSNSGGVSLINSALAGVVTVKQNSGGATVKSNCVLGSLTVTGNTGTVVDHPNNVVGNATLQ